MQTGVRYETLRKHYGKWVPTEGRDELRKFAAAEPGLLRGQFVPASLAQREQQAASIGHRDGSEMRGGGLEPGDPRGILKRFLGSRPPRTTISPHQLCPPDTPPDAAFCNVLLSTAPSRLRCRYRCVLTNYLPGRTYRSDPAASGVRDLLRLRSPSRRRSLDDRQAERIAPPKTILPESHEQLTLIGASSELSAQSMDTVGRSR